jgi:biotin transport system substrate-specific component
MHVAGFVAGTAGLYLFGTAWYCIYAKIGFMQALAVAVVPFLIGDALKIGLAVVIGSTIRNRVKRDYNE